jgi:uncharacterized membrane protein
MELTETHKRTIAKTVTYRVGNTVITFLMTLLLFGVSAALAGSLALAQIILGSAIFYLHDRVWQKFAWGKTQSNENPRRSLAKTICYRLLVLIAGFIVARLIITNSNETAAWWTITSMALSMIFYYIHERIWVRITWGWKETDHDDNAVNA